jgi:hypothetical protein
MKNLYIIFFLSITCILFISVIINNTVRKRENLDLIDTSDNNPLIKALKDMVSGFEKLGSLVNVANNAFKAALNELKKIADKVVEELKRTFTDSCYKSEAQCWKNEGGRAVFQGNTPHNTVPYLCLKGGAWIREANGAYPLGADWKDDYFCKLYLPDKCGNGGCWMQSR